jgi:hypothetical protein
MVLAGCSSGPVPNADVETFCLNKATQECQVAASCGVVPDDPCISLRQTDCMTAAMQATASGTRSYSQPNAAACISAVQSAYSSPPAEITFATLQSVDQICEQVFPGTVMDGDVCTIDFDCANNEVCSPVEPGSTTTTTTICAQPTQVSEGAGCANPGEECPTGTFCTGVPAKCEVGGTAANGATCTTAIGCATGDYCQINAGAKKGTCIQTGSMGATCMSDVNCSPAAPYCDVNIPPKSGKGPGSCQTGLFAGLGTDGEDCKAFGGAN